MHLFRILEKKHGLHTGKQNKKIKRRQQQQQQLLITERQSLERPVPQKLPFAIGNSEFLFEVFTVNLERVTISRNFGGIIDRDEIVTVQTRR